MKRILALILALVMCLSLAACSSDRSNDDDDEIECPECGEENSEKRSFCEDCGAKLDKDYDPTPSPRNCKTCDGEGKIECKTCDGRGYFITDYNYRLLCSDCWEGYTDCPNCEEEPEPSPTGDLPIPTLDPTDPYPTNCYKCNNTGKIDCTFCNGAGGWDETKYSSDFTGNGGVPYTVHQTCRTCGGNKKIDCPYC